MFLGRGGAPTANSMAKRRGVSFLSSAANDNQLNESRSSGLDFLRIPLMEHRCLHSECSIFNSSSVTLHDNTLHFMIAAAMDCQFPLHSASATGRKDGGICRVTGFLYITVICKQTANATYQCTVCTLSRLFSLIFYLPELEQPYTPL